MSGLQTLGMLHLTPDHMTVKPNPCLTLPSWDKSLFSPYQQSYEKWQRCTWINLGPSLPYFWRVGRYYTKYDSGSRAVTVLSPDWRAVILPKLTRRFPRIICRHGTSAPLTFPYFWLDNRFLFFINYFLVQAPSKEKERPLD